ncbi:hypothetical protein F4782DRAFT_484688 [Xylaria castorea]|nr:hypothetical protein F4782DRAFT_484688 [Xylaria castorea]
MYGARAISSFTQNVLLAILLLQHHTEQCVKRNLPMTVLSVLRHHNRRLSQAAVPRFNTFISLGNFGMQNLWSANRLHQFSRAGRSPRNKNLSSSLKFTPI